MSFYLRDEKPTPQENNSEVLKALQDDESAITGVAGMAELQEDRYESMKNEILFHVSALLSTILISFSFDFLNYSNMTTLHLAHSFWNFKLSVEENTISKIAFSLSYYC